MPTPSPLAPPVAPTGAAEAAPRQRAQAEESTEPVVVEVRDLSKRFRIYAKPLDRLKDWLHLGGPRFTEFWAVRKVSFEVRRGECLGVVGANGSGKSTLLKIITGALYPTEGTFRVQGRVLSLIELGTGLNPHLTGRANIINAATLLGFPVNFAREKMAEIEAFAEIGEFFDRQVNLYSSGMKVRLAFSMFACFRPEVFIVDEALSVGDVFFQQKCAARLRELLDGGMTMIFVSHDQNAVLNLCDRAMVLSHGEPIFYGNPEEAVSRYIAALSASGGAGQKWGKGPRAAAAPKAATTLAPKSATAADGAANADPAAQIIARDILGDRRDHRHGTGGVQIVAARVTDAAGKDTFRVLMGETLSFHVLLEAHEEVAAPRAGIRFHDRFNNLVFSAGSFQVGCPLPPLEPGQRLVVRFDVTMDVEPGQYTFGLGASEPAADQPNAGLALDRIDVLGPVIVGIVRENIRPFYGAARLPMRVSYIAGGTQETGT